MSLFAIKAQNKLQTGCFSFNKSNVQNSFFKFLMDNDLHIPLLHKKRLLQLPKISHAWLILGKR